MAHLDQRYTTAHLSTPAERHSLFLKGNYEINEYVNAFVQANYVNSKVTTLGNYAPAVTLWSVSVPRDESSHRTARRSGNRPALPPTPP